MQKTKIGLALGAGGARGLAHIKILEAFDEIDIKPSIISGSSIGAIIGAAYASGLTAQEIRESVDDLLKKRDSKIWEFYKNSDVRLLLNLFDLDTKSGGFIKGDKFQKFFEKKIGKKNFDELIIPLKVVATEYWEKEQKIFKEGDLLHAIRASYSLPVLFTPQTIDDKLYIDGGMVNPLPYDMINSDCDITIAVDVSSKNTRNGDDVPPFYEILFSSFQIMQNSIMNEKLKISEPDHMIRPEIEGVKMLEFSRASEIYEQAEPAKQNLIRILKTLQ